jgi:adenosylhomocysteine nucleosidase
VAVPEEARPMLRRLPARWPVQVWITGMGVEAARQAITSALDRARPGLLLTAGFAGGLHPALRVGDIVYEATAAPELEPCLREVGRSVRFATTDHVVCTAAEKRELRKRSGADAVEMESTAVRALCQEAGVPWAMVRVISDAAEDALPLAFDRCVDRRGRVLVGAVLRECARQPSVIPGLIRLRRVTRRAAERLAECVVRSLAVGWRA